MLGFGLKRSGCSEDSKVCFIVLDKVIWLTKNFTNKIQSHRKMKIGSIFKRESSIFKMVAKVEESALVSTYIVPPRVIKTPTKDIPPNINTTARKVANVILMAIKIVRMILFDLNFLVSNFRSEYLFALISSCLRRVLL